MIVSDHRIDDVIFSYHGSIKAMAIELKERRAKEAHPKEDAMSQRDAGVRRAE
jgi:hypothetical protein